MTVSVITGIVSHAHPSLPSACPQVEIAEQDHMKEPAAIENSMPIIA